MFKLIKILVTGLCLLAFISPVQAGSLGDRIGKIFGNKTAAEEEFLKPDDAFVLSAEVVSADKVIVNWRIAEKYYLYRDKFSFNVSNPDVSITGVSLPSGEVEEDPNFGRVEINTGDVLAGLSLKRESLSEQSINLTVGYQGCKKDAICYPPLTRDLALLLPAGSTADSSASGGVTGATTGTTTVDAGAAQSNSEPVAKLSEQDAITAALKDKSALLNILVFFGFGLLLALTPCVFPMIPILSGIIVGQGNKITSGRAFFISLTYVVAMAATYAVLGVIAGFFGFNLQAASQNTWVLVLFSAIFIALALSMFGFYELQVPASWQNKLNQASDQQKSGSLRGVAVMGVLSAVIVGPCVAPPLAGALLFISQTGDALLGGLALFALGLGMGVPLLVIGTSAGKLLPRAGAWMDAVKCVFGVLMLAVAVWFLGRILPGPVTLLLWALLFIVSAIYMGALDRIEAKTGWFKLWKGLGVALLIYGTTLIIGAASGGGDVLNPLQGIAVNGGGEENKLEFAKIKSVDDLDRVLATARLENKTVMLDYYADWCITCKEMEKFTFPDSAVQTALNDVVLIKADVTANDEQDAALLNRFELFGPPAILFFRNGEELKSYRLVGFVKPAKFADHINQVKRL